MTQAARARRAWGPAVQRASAGARHAGALFEKHQTGIADGIVRESGALRPFAEFQTSKGAAEERYEAAALTAALFGVILRSVQDRLSFSRRRSVAALGVIAPFNVPMVPALQAVAPTLERRRWTDDPGYRPTPGR
ncbi:aldehyde dehydrogenase family protein [Streptomyces liliifuscus]|uniref:aldehyde dehydrogenase family protein n=1 Tax=Streptomyces liliifuscus TaxID=2797636 RepID=UPI001F193383|nr:aldehyde dehydrogenase family protein [Streptomyces liliifuscus]